jgi:hypothetical protein
MNPDSIRRLIEAAEKRQTFVYGKLTSKDLIDILKDWEEIEREEAKKPVYD